MQLCAAPKKKTVGSEMMVLLWIEHVSCSFIVLYATRLVCLRWRNTAPEGQPHCAPGGPGGRCAGSPSWPPQWRRKRSASAAWH